MGDNDDLPLSALAAKKPKVDDDIPLAALVKAKPTAKGAVKSPGRPAASPAAKGKAAAKAGAKRQLASSSSSSSGSSSSSSSSDDDKPMVKKRRQASTKARTKKAPKAEERGDEDEDQEQYKVVNQKQRGRKEKMIAEFLCRWWYFMDDWPPKEDEFYVPKLREQKLRKVRIEEWEWVPEFENGLQKAYELSQYKGLFRSAAGKLVDLRPQATCPCYNNVAQWDMLKLCENLKQACETQLKELDQSKYREAETVEKLRKRITELRHEAAKLREMSSK